ncbi:hypothetical protein SLEP1_g57290 [Rubroshorea leprosula]|uniref:Uncharacterized protein n=1 Tax=Rubroshorea leprosula TaxID=152421 RepID=A0AAV5MPS3_9ROSI|nr:hypothetical protein SLEP1_g57290 [Rubroshorea leprosula]
MVASCPKIAETSASAILGKIGTNRLVKIEIEGKGW